MVNNASGTATTLDGKLLLAGHTVDVSLNSVIMSARSAATTNGSDAQITFDTGTFTANSVAMVARTGSTFTTGASTGTITIGGGTASLGAVTMAVNTVTNSTAAPGAATANLNITGGTVTASSINMTNAVATGIVKTATATINLTGGTFTLGGNITRTNGGGAENATVNLNGVAATLDMGGKNIGTLAAPITFTAAQGTLKNLAELNGGGVLTKTTGGTLIFDGTNAYTGGTTVSAGLAQIAAGSSLGSVNGTLTVNAGTLDLNGNNLGVGNFTGAGGTIVNNATATTRTLTIGGNGGTGGNYQGVIANNTTGTGVVAVSKTGAGTLTLSGANAFSGDLNVDGGTLSANRGNNTLNPASSALGNPQIARNISVNNGGTLRFDAGDTFGSGDTTVASTLVINAGGTVTNTPFFTTLGAVQLNGGTLTGTGGAANPNFQMYSLQGTVTVGGTAASAISGSGIFAGYHLSANTIFNVADATGDAATDLNVSGTLIDRQNALGAGGLTKNGAGTMALTGLNTYTGSTIIPSGTILASSIAPGAGAQSLGAGPAVSLGVAGTSSGRLNYTGAAGTLDKNITALGNGTDTVQNSGGGLLTLSGTLTKNGTTLTLNGGANGIAVTGQIVGGAPNSDLTVSGGATTLSNDNSYKGATTVTSTGALAIVTGGSLSGTTGMTVNSGGALLVNNNVSNVINATTPVPLVVNGGTFALGPTVSADTTKTQTFAALTLSGASTVDFGSGAQGSALVFAPNVNFASGSLKIFNWSQGAYVLGTPDTGALNDTQDRFLFDGTGSGLSAAQLANIQFYSDGGVNLIGSASQVPFGSQFEIVPVPEPATGALLGSVALCALLGIRRRKK